MPAESLGIFFTLSHRRNRDARNQHSADALKASGTRLIFEQPSSFPRKGALIVVLTILSLLVELNSFVSGQDSVDTVPAAGQQTDRNDKMSRDRRLLQDSCNCPCIEGFYREQGLCRQCESGAWCSGEQRNVCPAHTTSMPGSAFAVNCTCIDGYTGFPGQPCAGCSVGTWCRDGILNTCPSWTSSKALSSRAVDCRCNAGYSGPDGGPCTPCSAG
eukprot:1260310-Rhodomonas_salina.1